MSPECTSTQVFRPKGPELFHFPRYGRRRTKSERGNVDSERPDTTACRPWAMKKHSQSYSLLGLSTPVRRFDCAFLNWARFRRIQRLTRSINVLRARSFLSSYCFPQLANASSGCGPWLFVDDQSAHERSPFFLAIRFSLKP